VSGLFITFEGTEGGGKSTQTQLLAERLRGQGYKVLVVREPGGTPVGEEIRHTLKHSEANRAMTNEAELLLMNASRAQLVREIIRPALAAGEIVVCDRFFDSTTAYQGYGRGLDLAKIRLLTDFVVEETRPDLTLLLDIPVATSEKRRQTRRAAENLNPAGTAIDSTTPARDRMEELDRAFFQRVHDGFRRIAAAEPDRVRVIDATQGIEEVSQRIWGTVAPLLEAWTRKSKKNQP
jgi:dTMP kinase